MFESKDDVALYNQLFSASQNALQNAHYEAAYHALAGALHIAQDMKDTRRLEAISQEAKDQLDYINKHAPNSSMSSETASNRIRGVDMFWTLAQVASVRAQMYKPGKSSVK